MRLVCMVVIILSLVRVEAVSSFLTDGKNKTSTSMESKNKELDDMSILRQMINQETIIRLALVKNFHALVNDVIVLKQSLAKSEWKISELQRAVTSLQKENRELKKSSSSSDSRIMEEEKRQFYFNKTNSVLNDVKIEVRYLSATLLDFKERTETENESRDKKYEELQRHFNSSIADLYVKNSQIKQDVTSQTALIHGFEDSQSKTKRAFLENLNRTTSNFETKFQSFKNEQLKLSTAVASLELANMNMSKSNCENSRNHAFSAGISLGKSVWTGGTLVFPVVIYSEGTGYNPSTGIFTAPTAGTYVFYVSVQSAHQKLIYLDIVLNGSAKVRAMAWYNSGSSVNMIQTGTNLVILHLQTGDKVWVRRGGGDGYYSDGYHITTFSGFKLF
uniref:C1q domain-containing protein n=3 Tax=Magallana gigas TaxID=29159 RepID=A0A8W8JB26_MAGGI